MATFVLLDKRPRNPQTQQTISVAVPPDLLERKIVLRLLMDANDLTDIGLTIRYAAQASYDPTGINWVDIFGGTWIGGFDVEGNPKSAPHQELQTSAELPSFIRGEIDWNKKINFGLEAELV